ncbi:MAG: hypothetical protein R3C12_25410 [Planctomycetaceae bacterium]|nr:hypothetical protein [Planctomycetaceae bacterium]
MSITTLKLLLRAGALLAYWWLCLAVWTMDGNTVRACVPALLVGVSLLFIWLGPITGALAMILLGMSAEALSQLPAGRLVFAAAVTGLVLLHLSRLQNWSPIGRGLLMSIVGAFLWVGLLAFFQTPADDLPEVWARIGRNSLNQSLLAGLYWLITATLGNGLRVVWKETATRPVRFGTDYD